MFKLFSRHSPRANAAPRDEAQEMILLTLERASENGRTLSPDDLARELSFPPAPHLQSLISQSLLRVDTSGALALTDSGRDRALALLRRHRLVERHFTDVLGLDWARAHEEADKLEHVVSAEAEQALAEQLGNPDTCPHGNPIPRARADSARAALTSLADCAPCSGAIIARIGLETPDGLRHLATLGLLPEVEIVVENQAPFGGPVMVRVGRAHYALGRDLAARIWVREIRD
jgi:DtxR family Mn-dependent transcriptional regulator